MGRLNSMNKAVKKSYMDDETREESLTDSITSSYGIGPTDDKGMPLFGLKALRRQNKPTPDVEPDFTPYEEEPSPRDIKDSSGRPLFGLKALQISKSPARNDDEKPASEPADKTPLKDLVNRHDKHARGNAVSQPQQHTPSRLRDTFAQNRNEEFIRKESDAEDVNRLTKDRGQSLRAMIQRHESLTESDRRPETVTTSSSFSSSTVVRSSAVRKPDGGISVKSQVIQGETISKDGEKPKSRVRTAEYSYETPKDEDDYVTDEEHQIVDGRIVTRKTTKAVSSRSNTTESVLSRTSRKSLSPERKSHDEDNTAKKTTKRPISEKLSHLSRKFSNEPEDTGRRSSGHEPHYSSHTKSSLLHSNVYTSTHTDRHSSTRYGDDDTSSRRRSATPPDETSLNRRRSSTPLDELKESLFRKSSTTHDEGDASSNLFTRYGRGGAVKALSQKFQQAGAEAESSKTTSSYPKAGLILRSASFKHTNGDLTPPDSPTYKQSASMEGRVGSPTALRLGRDGKDDREGRRWSRDGEHDYNEYESTRRVTSRSVTETSDGRSFLGSSSKVTGVQDIISRMKAADQEDVGFESPEDIQARSLLNKFLGASVMMSGMEPLVKASGNSSATLVSQVERQRILHSSPTETSGQSYVITDTLTDYDNIDHIWDERKLRQLLDACTNYEGRRKIRARLRTVMAEKSACEEVVAAAQEEENLKSGDGSKTVQAASSSLTTTTKSSDGGYSKTTTERSVFSTAGSTKAASTNKPISPFAKFQQLDRQNSGSSSTPRIFK
ncbi:UNVERIFIED_CONTAM: hypothetical protein PYX00_005156 [Menopon gallinae]|uniref:Smoothelin domain-containing protein n=3 Tax=Menopon gallinae TaxID=328185 RepID=A0AAW2HRQ6_9NEOP